MVTCLTAERINHTVTESSLSLPQKLATALDTGCTLPSNCRFSLLLVLSVKSKTVKWVSAFGWLWVWTIAACRWTHSGISNHLTLLHLSDELAEPSQRLCHDEFVRLDSTINIDSPDDSREVLCFTRVLFWQQASDLPEGRETPRQNYIEGLVLKQTCKIYWNIPTTPP